MPEPLKEITIPVEIDAAIYFTEPIMSDHDNGITVTQTLRGDAIFVAFKGVRYKVNVEDIARKICEGIRHAD